MAGRGPAPKDPSKRARRNADPIPQRIVEVTRAERRGLPEDVLADEQWHPATVRWWQRWCDSPLSAEWTEVDWSELEVCALLHHRFMDGHDTKLAAELRQRMAKFGATAEDRARLRIVFADADKKESERPTSTGTSSSATSRFGPLRAVES